MTFETTNVKDVVILKSVCFPDERGFFREISRKTWLQEAGIQDNFIQVNTSFSKKGVIRGMHYQLAHQQSKLVSVAYGTIYDVIIDCRKSSPTFGKWIGVELSDKNATILYVPKGFAHGFQVLSDVASVVYQCDDYFTPGDEYGIHHASLDIDWRSLDTKVVSEKDMKLPAFKDIPLNHLPN